MSLPTATIGSSTMGHGCWPPTIICQGAGTVIAEGLPVALLSHAGIPHTCVVVPFPSHPTAIASGSGSVIAEGLSVSRLGDSMICGDIISVGVSTVITGG